MRASKLRISSSFSFPHEVSTETLCAVGKRGTGKTNAIVCLVEEMHGAGLPFVVIDPTGVWWGLRLDKNGKDPGLDVIIFGGDHGDVDLEETAGAVVADFVIESHRACILDLSGFRKGQAVRFMTDFAERLYHAKGKAKHRDALHVIIDEADAYAPQRPMPDTARLLGAIEDLIRRGRSRGIGMSLITQRPAVLNKNVMAQTEVLMAFQLTAPLDQKAIREWVHVNAEEEKLKMLEHDLATAKQGDCYIWSPSWLKIFEWVHIRERRTFDSSATPKAGARRVAYAELPPIDKEALKERFAATLERKKANDPDRLRAEIASLKKQIDGKVKIETKVERVEVRVPVIPESLQNSIRSMQNIVSAALEKLTASVNESLQVAARTAARPEPVRRNAVPVSTPTPAPRKVRETGEDGEYAPSKGERSILAAIAQRENGASKVQITLAVSLKKTSRNAYLQRLRKAGFVRESDGRVYITDAGLTELGSDYEKLPKGKELREYWLRRLPEGESVILRLAFDAYPRSIERADLDALTSYKKTSRNAFIQRLQGRELLVRGTGAISAREELFTDG